MIRQGVVLVLLLTGCHPPSVTNPTTDDGRRIDLGGDGGAATWQATVGPAPVLLSEADLPPSDKWREWKRDPGYLLSGGQQLLFFAGSPAPPSPVQRWTVGRVVAAEGKDLSAGSFQQLLTPQAGAWDAGDLFAPTVIAGGNVLGKPWALWYAASGDAQLPDYVTQIGLLSSMDGQSWERNPAQGPVLAVPPFSGADPQPTKPGPAAYGLTDPFVLQLGNNTLWMYYAGVDCDGSGCRYQILRAISQDGTDWKDSTVVLQGRPGVAEEAGGVAGPSVVLRDNRFYLAYTAVRDRPQRDRNSLRRSLITGTIGLAISTDGVSFTPASGPAPLFERRGFYAAGASSPSLFPSDTDPAGFRLLFTGVNNADAPNYSLGQASLSLL